MGSPQAPAPRPGWKDKWFKVIFESSTPDGKLFDIYLLALILISIVAVLLQSVSEIDQKFHRELLTLEWIITILFTVEYVVRLMVVHKPLKYAQSFYGIIDLLSILPSYLSLFFPQSQALIVIRSLRLMRVFRIFRLSKFVREGMTILFAMKASARRILVFLVFVFLLSVVFGTIVYVVENGQNKAFTSIPQSIYWSIVTITTVGYGDISPVTPLGKFFASLIMLLGYAIIAVPTGIVTVEMSKSRDTDVYTKACPACSQETHAPDAVYCMYCGHSLQENKENP